MDASLHMEEIPYLIQFTILTLDHGVGSSRRSQGGVYRNSRICLVFTRDDSGSRQILESKILHK